MAEPRPCTYCKMPYLEPCDGKNEKCGNRDHADKVRAAKDKESK